MPNELKARLKLESVTTPSLNKMMKTFTVYAKRTEWLRVDIHTTTAEKAMELAEELEGDAFEECDGTMEFEIDNAQFLGEQ